MSIDSTNNGYESQGPDEATNKPVESMAEAESGESTETLSKSMPEPPQPEAILTGEEKVPNKKLCGVCNENEGKYKCSRCYLPYCSVTCSKQHKINHPPDEPKPSSPETQTSPSTNGKNRPGTLSASTFKGPFHALSLSPDIKALFTQYPNLPSLLEKINSATLPPISDYTSSGLPTSSSIKNGRVWTSDKGIQKGIEALRKARNEDGIDGESVREYGRVVLAVLEREEGELRTEDVVRREMEAENARIVGMLLNGDIG